jgi:predicted nucleotidyltransferase
VNPPDTHRAILRHHIATVEAKHPLKVLGKPPRGAAAHLMEENALDLLAEKRPGLSLFGLAQAEIDLADLIGRPVGIVLLSGLRGREAEELPKLATPL